MLQWYEKLAFAGIAIAFCGWMMFVVGLGFMMKANRQAREEFRASIAEGHNALKGIKP